MGALSELDAESDVVRRVAMGLAFLIALALNLDPQRRLLALAVFGGGALAFFVLAGLAALDDDYAGPQLRWYVFAAWGVLLFAIGVWTESAVGGIGGSVIAVYAAVRAWLFDALADDEKGAESDEEPDWELGDGDAARQPVQQGATTQEHEARREQE
jgi:hypothetical protein